MSGAISSPGIGSGIDVQSLVNQLLQADFGPQQTTLKNKASTLNAQLSAFGTLSSDVSSIGDSLSALKDLQLGYQASCSDSAVLTATTDSTATAGNYSISVTQLAQAQSLASASYSAPTDVVGTGTLTFQFGSYDNSTTPPTFTANAATSSKTITLDSSNNTLQGVATAINQANFGVSATIVNDGSGYRLALTSKSGTQNALQITAGDPSLAGLAYAGTDNTSGVSQTAAAQDAKLSVNGIAITGQSNTLSDVVQGVTLNLTGISSGVPVSLDVTPDSSAVTKKVQAFVDAYNGLANDVGKLASYDSKTKQAGLLLGDPTLRNLVSQFQNGVVQKIPGAGTGYATLMDLGVTANADGTLSLDSGKLTDAVNTDYGAVVTALQGAGKQLGTLVDNITGSGGILTSRTDTINTQLGNIQDQLSRLNTRMQAEQQSLLQEYAAMDTLVANLKSTGDYLTQQLSSIAAIGTSSSSSSSSGG
jgi:flagellar hook-associated protein 2